MDHAGMEQDILELDYYRTGKLPKEWTQAYRDKQARLRKEAIAYGERAGVIYKTGFQNLDSLTQDTMKILNYKLNGGK